MTSGRLQDNFRTTSGRLQDDIFLMLLSLGLGSQIGIIEGLTSTLFDHPRLHKAQFDH